jgi:hypothetical protein
MKIVFIADFFVDQILGGGELNNEELIIMLQEDGHTVQKIQSQFVDRYFIESNSRKKFIVANFANLQQQAIDSLYGEEYIIYEHDHKYLRSRDPSTYPDFKAPAEELVNIKFYKNARAVLCQSQFHLNIIKKNVDLDNLVNLSGNIWSLESLDLMRQSVHNKKTATCAIMDSPISHKNTADAVKYCEATQRPYNLVKSSDYKTFLNELGSNETFVFFPKTPETLSRIVVEARMMGMSVIVNKLIGATQEPWYKLKGDELITHMHQKRETIKNIVVESLT